MTDIHSALVAGLERGELAPVIGAAVPFDEAPRSHRLVESSGQVFGKVVLVP